MVHEVDVLIIGGGPAALVAARLLHLLEYRVRVAAPQVRAAATEIVLPLSALQSFGPLGMRDAVLAAGRPITSHDVRWGDERSPLGAGRETGLQIRESDLRSALRDVLPDELFVEETSSPSLTETGVIAGSVAARTALITSPDQLPAESRPSAVGETDRVRSVRLDDVDRTAFPDGHHLLHTFDASWAWAIRTGEAIQFTHFGPDETPQRIDTPIGTVDVTGTTRPVVATRTAGTLTPRLLPIGAACFTVSPLSSLGTAHAVHTATDAVAVVNSMLQGIGDPARLADWYGRTSRLRASRTHALVADSCRSAATAHDTTFWKSRADTRWETGLEESSVVAVRHAKRFIDWTQSGEIELRVFRRAPEIRTTPSLVRRGPVIREEEAFEAPGGAALERTVVEEYRGLLDFFDSGGGVADAVAALMPTGLEPAARETARKRITQIIGRCFECRLLESGDD